MRRIVELSEQTLCWVSYSGKGQPVWFWVLENVKSDLKGWGIKKEVEREIVQELKVRGLKSLALRGNMLNLREKHIPRIKEIYISVLEEYITWA